MSSASKARLSAGSLLCVAFLTAASSADAAVYREDPWATEGPAPPVLVAYASQDTADLGSAPSTAVPPAPRTPPSPAVPSAPPEPPAPPVPPRVGSHKRHRGHDDDRVVVGGSERIEKDDHVGDVTVMGGSTDVFGHVRGDLAVMGGSATIHKGARVDGDVAAIGGVIHIEEGARVDGDIGSVGGTVIKAPGAIIGGSTDSEDDESSFDGTNEETEETAKPTAPRTRGQRFLSELAHDVGSSLAGSALLFALGTVLIALLPQRMDKLKLELAARPMRCFALGVVGVPAALAALVAVTVALLITILGIPLACIAFPLGLTLLWFAAAAGVCAALQTSGELLLRHKTQNPYVHLALGCVLLFVLGAIPWVGGWAKLGVGLVGVGATIATRAAGLIPSRFAARKDGGDTGDAPYRAPADV